MLAPKVYKLIKIEETIKFATEAIVTGNPNIELYTNLDLSRRTHLI